MPISGVSVGPEGFGVSTGGGVSTNKFKYQTRKAYEYALRYQPNITRQNTLQASMVGLKGTAEEARRQGLHPLFALGGGGGVSGGAPAFVGGWASSPGGCSSYSSKNIRPEETALNDANLKLIEKRTAWIQEQIDASIAARTNQGTNAQQDQFSRIWEAYGDADKTGMTVKKTPVPQDKFGGWTTGRTPTAQQIQDHYGDFVELIYGIGRLTDDGLSNLWKMLRAPKYTTSNPSHRPRYKPAQRRNYEDSP